VKGEKCMGAPTNRGISGGSLNQLSIKDSGSDVSVLDMFARHSKLKRIQKREMR